MPEGLQGLALCERFYHEAVAPALRDRLPRLRYDAALIGWGSEVLGYDDAQSTDHNWGPRLQIFLAEEDLERCRGPLCAALGDLPLEFLGHPTDFPLMVNDDQRGTAPPIRQNIDIETVAGFFTRYLGCDPRADLRAADWLTMPEPKLLAATAGRVFHSGLGELDLARQRLRYYPRDVWVYMLAAQWSAILEEQAFVGRCGAVGDELGSALVAARQASRLMRLCFLAERTYAPYSKWFGTAFSRLGCASEMGPILADALRAQGWAERQRQLARAYEVAARLHNALGLTAPMEEGATHYYGRPYLVVGDDRYAAALRGALADGEVRRISHTLGSVSQWVESAAQLSDPALCAQLRALYRAL